MFGLSHWELLIVLAVLLLLFAPRLPGVVRSLGQTLLSFKAGLGDQDSAEEWNRNP